MHARIRNISVNNNYYYYFHSLTLLSSLPNGFELFLWKSDGACKRLDRIERKVDISESSGKGLA